MLRFVRWDVLAPKYSIYLVPGDGAGFRPAITSNPRLDAWFLNQRGISRIYVANPPVSLFFAELILEELNRLPAKLSLATFGRHLKFAFRQTIPGVVPVIKEYDTLELGVQFSLLPELEHLISGRCLLGTELPDRLAASGIEIPWNPEDWMQALYLHSLVRREAAVTLDSFGIPYCRRCGATSGIYEDNCLFCGNRHCFTCSNCRTMGQAKSCTPLYSQPFSGQIMPPRQISPVLEFELTPPQQYASAELLKFLENGGREFLVWAVCGGGKTEVCFNAVARVLSLGGKVLVAIPRKDIVQELLPRFQKAFPDQTIAALYGGGERFSDAALVLATTHQCLRFYQAFDLVILDEGDAFPYFGSEFLHFAVKRALKPAGRLVVMTATPDRTLMARTERGALPKVLIPARYHRQPLAVPEYKRWSLKRPEPGPEWNPSSEIRCFLEESWEAGRKVLVFLPTVQAVEELGQAMCRWAVSHGRSGAYVHAKIAGREELKQSLARGELNFLVTSTVFERGITIPNLDVLVLNADYDRIFDARTLIQIAGRVGRIGDQARVVFAGSRETGPMKDAVRWIRFMNKVGLEQGFLTG
jgi:competence protein ComFA